MSRQHGTPSHYVLHVSDTHFVENDGRLHDKVDSDSHLAALFERLERSGQRPDAIVFTGDLADEGQPDAYARLRAIVEPAAARIGAEVIWVMGNHDARPAFRAGLLDAEPTQESVDAVYDIDGLRIVVLDSTVPGEHHGEITDAQLDWLRGVLDEPAPHGTLVALHHPPIPSTLDILEYVELADQHRLEAVIAGTDVRGVLGGHLHYSTTSTFAGVPVSVAAATCYTQDLFAADDGMRGVDGARAFNMVHVYSDRVVHTVVPLEDAETLYEMSGEKLRRFAAMTPDERDAALASAL
ncbi:phosphodiesterase [Rhodococcus rhodnii]|uniref:Phosphoesterase n=2 Tax=Rhodococcus rhodnii TaxID=38312 RepID=R7WPY1_9NOCA|nr:phosphodiesterase [Rhodococcus rhodnii]EOM77310.1 phosphoesterase [Rhodococcus rhodnii LMG 5362]TXG91693.1 phosphodiesterase [Rhodococcus rhodnii]